MLRRLTLCILTLALAGCALPMLAPAPAFAATDPFNDSCASSAAKNSPVCKTNGEDPISGKNGILYKVARILSLVAAVGAVVALIIGGFMYVSAGGDTGKAANARKTIIGALVGIVVIALAQLFIALVINLVQ